MSIVQPQQQTSLGPAGATGGVQQFGPVAEWYDALMADVPYDMWLDYLLSLWRRHGPDVRTPKDVLDVACGTGSMAFRFEEIGCTVVGVDISQAMIEVARERAHARRSQCRFLVQDAAAMDVGGRQFDLAYSVFDSINYITDPSLLASVFDRIGAALRDGGLLIFDVNTPYALRNAFFDQQDLRAQSPVRYRWRSTYSETTRLCTVHMEFWVPDEPTDTPTFVEVHTQRAYGEDELVGMLMEAGFSDIRTYQAYTFDPCTDRTDRAFFVARSGPS